MTTLGHRLDDEKAEQARHDTARQMRAFELIEASLAKRLPATLSPLVPELARGLCEDMGKHGYMFLPVMSA
ncbi:MAG: hypothetical protein CR217_10015 [Beijerinckiaceae bacterium]|nr:MAG: hypothetical protein CR217_10015 [Beijerinckiaceae bacterium]